MPHLVVTAFALFVLLPAEGLAAQTVDWSRAPHIPIALSSFRFEPATITLQHGQPYILDLANTGSGGHNIAAPEFFRAATVAGADAGEISNGRIEIAGHSQKSVRLVAPIAAGHYAMHCSHFMHSSMGMKGDLVVQ